MAVSEAELIARARDGDRRAFAQLVEPYRDRLWAVCLRTTRHRSDAEDALQDCLISAWQHIGSFRGESGVGTWLFRIASNASVAIIRKRRETTVDDSEAFDAMVDEAHSRRDHAGMVADRDRVQAALRTLNEDFRVALVLREFADYSYDDIAAYQQVSVQTVKSRLNRARAALAKALGSFEGDEAG